MKTLPSFRKGEERKERRYHKREIEREERGKENEK